MDTLENISKNYGKWKKMEINMSKKKTTYLLELLVFSFNPTWKCVEVIFDFVGCIFVG